MWSPKYFLQKSLPYIHETSSAAKLLRSHFHHTSNLNFHRPMFCRIPANIYEDFRNQLSTDFGWNLSVNQFLKEHRLAQVHVRTLTVHPAIPRYVLLPIHYHREPQSRCCIPFPPILSHFSATLCRRNRGLHPPPIFPLFLLFLQ